VIIVVYSVVVVAVIIIIVIIIIIIIIIVVVVVVVVVVERYVRDVLHELSDPLPESNHTVCHRHRYSWLILCNKTSETVSSSCAHK
jgi:hypothetical protein